MTIEQATSVHVGDILRMLAATPNPPNEDERTIQAILDDHMRFTYIDLAVPVLVSMAPSRAKQEVPIPWWVWKGDLAAAHLSILGVAARAVKRSIPTAGTWPTYGDFPGAGGTEGERKDDSERQADEHIDWLPGVTVSVSTRNPKMWEARSTIDAVIAVIPAVPLGPA